MRSGTPVFPENLGGQRMKILVLMHIENEGPGTLGEHLVAKNVTLRVCRLFDAEQLTSDASGFDAVVSMVAR